MASPSPLFLRDARIFCLAALLLHLIGASIGWNRPLLDHYSWRQTQTALTAAYLPIDGYRLDYSTPIFGNPAAIPLEFPLYAALTAGLSHFTGWPLDGTGRLVSLLGFLAASVAAALLMRRLVPVLGPEAPPLALGLLFLSPLYIFYSRAFLIETTALALALFFLEALLRSAEAPSSEPRRKWLWAAVALLLGALAGGSKVTVFLITCVPAAALLLEIALERGKRGALSAVLPAALALFLAALAALAWVRYSDAVKAANPLATAVLSSKNLAQWNFGVVAQYLSFRTYRQSFDRALPVIFGMKYGLLIFLPLLFSIRRLPRKAWLLGLGFLAGPLVFLNLFYVHEYYWTENALFLFLPLGGLLACFLRRWNQPWFTRLALLTLMIMMWQGYRVYLLPAQRQTDTAALDLAAAVEKQVAPEGVVLYLGYDYDPSIAYYTHRRALMDADMAGTKVFAATYQMTGPERVLAAVVTPEAMGREEARARLAALGFATEPVYASDRGLLFLKAAPVSSGR